KTQSQIVWITLNGGVIVLAYTLMPTNYCLQAIRNKRDIESIG
ncbi:uncharacterized protein METZ01_LOCUS286946, partial [marine metagenome]